MAKKKSVVKKVSKRVFSKKRNYKGRGPSGKPKHSKVAKLIKLAKLAQARPKKSSKKGKSKKRR